MKHKYKRSKEEQFATEIAHAFAKYGVTYTDSLDIPPHFFAHKMMDAMQMHLPEICKISNQLEHCYLKD